jgi:hypothetical protein
VVIVVIFRIWAVILDDDGQEGAMIVIGVLVAFEHYWYLRDQPLTFAQACGAQNGST